MAGWALNDALFFCDHAARAVNRRTAVTTRPSIVERASLSRMCANGIATITFDGSLVHVCQLSLALSAQPAEDRSFICVAIPGRFAPKATTQPPAKTTEAFKPCLIDTP